MSFFYPPVCKLTTIHILYHFLSIKSKKWLFINEYMYFKLPNCIAKFSKKIYNISKIKSILCDEETFFLRPKKESKKEQNYGMDQRTESSNK